MIRLLVAVVVCLALHPAAPAHASARGHERTIVVASGERATPPLHDARLHGAAALAAVVSLAPPSVLAVSCAAPHLYWVVARRLWLRGQRLLC